jgi:nucleoside-diphosphate-sugar epimerase
MSVRDLINTISHLIGKPIDAIYNTAEPGGVSRMRADLTQAAALLGYAPRVPLAEGLRRMIESDSRFQI